MPTPDTRRAVAERIATRAVGRNPNCRTRWSMCADAIEAELKARDERAAKIVDNWDYERLIPGEIATAIKNEES